MLGREFADVTAGIERTPDGRRLCVARELDAPAAVLWDFLTDTERWPEWGPSVRAVDCESRQIATGTTGRVETVGGLQVPFEITSCRNRRWTWRVGKIPATGHRVEGERPCRVVFEIPLLASGYAPMCARALKDLARLSDE
ncbi:SRPBCC family protein [Halorientalis sp.]|uniref:SRPBCC family protein n=1 Tax=Halorientalis sp. TaxID=1931229 RepID=UPI00261BE24F|nr:SRPBCC family protein [Halorientalis sp.]